MSRQTKTAILGYVPKNDEKKNSVHKGLRIILKGFRKTGMRKDRK